MNYRITQNLDLKWKKKKVYICSLPLEPSPHLSPLPNPLGLSSLFDYVCVCVCVLVAQLCLILFDPIVCNPPSSSVHGIPHARIL